jgi:hypothetical protein
MAQSETSETSESMPATSELLCIWQSVRDVRDIRVHAKHDRALVKPLGFLGARIPCIGP